MKKPFAFPKIVTGRLYKTKPDRGYTDAKGQWHPTPPNVHAQIEMSHHDFRIEQRLKL